jgi:acyl-CoA thioester hydrolase
MHKWTSQVREYEVDSYGGVNAATYLNYMQEARKHFLMEIGIDAAELYRQNIGLVVGRYEVDYLWSLTGGDEYVVKTSMERTAHNKVEFTQHIYRLKDNKLAVKCKNIGLAINIQTNKVEWPPLLDEILVNFPIVKKEN